MLSIPSPIPGALSAWADAPTAAPSPLPPLDARRARRGAYGMTDLGGWPVGLLPAEEIAADLAAAGLAFERGVGYSLDGEHLATDEAARAVADVLDAAAALLPDPRLAALRAMLADYEADFLDLIALADYEEADGTLPGDGRLPAAEWVRMTDWTAPTREALRLALRSASPADRAEDTPAVAAERVALRQALTATAREIRTSAAARRAALDLVRPHLTRARRAADPSAAEAFFARFDAEPAVRRSSLVAAYSEAGAPGDLSPVALRAAAEARWGAPTKRRGHFTYRPRRGC